MSATPRDLLKPRMQRIREVAESVQQQAGQANSQQIIYGCGLVVGSTKTDFTIDAGEVTFDGVSQPVEVAQVANTAVAAGAALSAGQNCYVLVELDKEGKTHQTVSAITGGTPVLPALTAERIAVGYLTLKGAFTPGTTELTAEMLKPIAYSAGNEAPTAGF